MRTVQEFEKRNRGIFSRGVVEQGPLSGVYFSDEDIGRLVKRVAVKLRFGIWTMRFSWSSTSSFESVAKYGCNIPDTETIKRLLNSDDELMQFYRK